MRGIGCLLTGIELFPGDVQGGSDTPAGWSMGISVDQHLKNRLQENPETQTRFGSLEFGVMVPDRADTWTRWSYAGPNQPMAPISDPYQMFDKLYGQTQNKAMLASVLDDLSDDFRKIESMVSPEDRVMLKQHLEMVRSIEKEIKSELKLSSGEKTTRHPVPQLEPNVEEQNDNMPLLCKMQMDLLLSSLVNDFTRIATFQITNSVGNAKMKWLDIDEGHHSISHEPDSNEEAYEQLIQSTLVLRASRHLARLSETPERWQGSMLDHTTLVWTNELGKGNSTPEHSLRDGRGWTRFQNGTSYPVQSCSHNRLLMSICEAMGYPTPSFGNADYCGDGTLTGLYA